MATALDGIRVLDLSRLLPGPYASLLLADLGAEVIKVEEPGLGDYARWNPPHYGNTGVGSTYIMLNRNKKSLALNLKSERGKEIFRRLVRHSDVVLESFRPGVMDRLGVGYAALKLLNPRLIYCAITGYGQDGPYKDHVGHDINYMGYAGALGITGERGRGPLMPGVQVADIGGGSLMAAFAILAALIHRERSGKGQFLDVSMTDGVVSWLAIHFGPYFATGRVPQRGEERLNGGWVCYGIYGCKDGKYVTIGALEPKFWANFCKVIGREDLVEHQYATGAKRDEVEGELRALFKTKTQGQWLELLQSVDICAGPVNSLADAVENPQLRHRELFQNLEHPRHGPIRQVGFPVKFSATPARMESPPPDLGEHTDEVLSRLGYSGEEIAGFRKDGVV